MMQVRGFLRAISRQRKQEVLGMATAISLGLSSDNDAIQKFLREE